MGVIPRVVPTFPVVSGAAHARNLAQLGLPKYRHGEKKFG